MINLVAIRYSHIFRRQPADGIDVEDSVETMYPAATCAARLDYADVSKPDERVKEAEHSGIRCRLPECVLVVFAFSSPLSIRSAVFIIIKYSRLHQVRQ